MEIRIEQLLEGAKRAEGLTVVIDVFRAFTVECTAAAMGAAAIRPVASLEEAWEWKRREPDAILAGERGGRRCPGFDCGNSPSELLGLPVAGRMLIHTTSAGTQGAANALGATELLGAALVNAEATAAYILQKAPQRVTLVCMGLAGERETEEDTLCAEYIRARLLGHSLDISREIDGLRFTSGAKFFRPELAEVFPQADFDLCTRLNRYPLALRIDRGGEGLSVHPIDMRT